jgi:DNA polymerase-3 subunit alpha
MLASLARAMRYAEQSASNSSTGQDDLFGLDTPAGSHAAADSEFVEAKELDEHERLRAEKETLGFYLQGHPISRYERELIHITTSTLSSVNLGIVRIAGYIETVRTRSGQRGRMAELRIDDRTARVHVNIYSEVYEQYRAALQKDKLVIIAGEAVADDYYETGFSIRADKVVDLAELRAICGYLRLKTDKQMMQNGLLAIIKDILKRHAGRKSQVLMDYDNGPACGTVTLGDEWRVEISDNLLDELNGLLGGGNVSVEYRDVHKFLAPKQKFKFISGLN